LNQLSPAVRRIATILALTIVSVGAYALVAVAPADAATPPRARNPLRARPKAPTANLADSGSNSQFPPR